MKKISKTILILSLSSILTIGNAEATELADDIGDLSTDIEEVLEVTESNSKNLSINDGVNLKNPPRVLEEGKKDNSEQIKKLEESIFSADISYNAAKFLLENSPETVKNIKESLHKQMKKAKELLDKSNEVLSNLREETNQNHELDQLREAYRSNKVMLESANMLIRSTPQTIKNVEDKLKSLVEKSSENSSRAEELLKKAEEKEFYKLKELNRKTIGLYFTTPSEEEILDYWRNYQSKAISKKDYYGVDLIDPESDEILEINPDLNIEKPGLLSKAALEDINHLTNTVRYSLGLEEVSVSEEKSHYAQSASVINSINGKLSHSPKVPVGMSEESKLYQDGYLGASKSNIHMGVNLLRQINSYIRDDDDTNWDRVGHRKWLINPFADDFGYGYYNRYSASYVFRNSFPEVGYEVVAYPSNVGLSEFFNEDTPFSFSVPDKFDISNVTIKMTDLNSGKITEYKTGKNIYVTNTPSKSGYLDNLSWGLGHEGKHGEQYEIEIDGIKVDGVDFPINYTVNFISLEKTNR